MHQINELFQRYCGICVKCTDLLAAQGRDVPTNAKVGAQVAGDRADIGALAAMQA